MIDPTSTDALAVAVRNRLRHCPKMADTLYDPAIRFAAILRQQLPNVPEEHVAAVLLHLGLPHLLPELRSQRTITEHLVSEYVAAFVGVVGEQIYTSMSLFNPQCAWHFLQIHDKPDSFTGERAEVTCPDECRQLPPGAVCWYVHESRRAEWPTEPGMYRIRPYHHTVQRGEDGDVEMEFQVQKWDGGTPPWWPVSGQDGAPF